MDYYIAMAVSKNARRLRVSIGINALLLLGTIGIICLFKNDSDTYLRMGPTNDLVILGISINTIGRYIGLLLLITIMNVTDVLISEIAMPIIGFNVYNPD